MDWIFIIFMNYKKIIQLNIKNYNLVDSQRRAETYFTQVW